ncbi:LysR substrate-binding domain-containing protein [Arvimicrobium flavum]|uniref:LysR substrate-binding domain-containing protein n=1 Tax=Arvimicrobium flavum TaxID=3393320 RepID=UPI00237ADE37|nr:LysR substrate-binding domain-containing protein [Mesorhizobium shangrilense]
MDARQLKYFTSIVECASVSMASRQLNVAQPALSQQIARLEQEVGAPLFLRSNRGVTVTAKGLALYRHAKFILRQFDRALLAAQETRDEVSGHVILGLPPTTNCQLGVPIVERLQRSHPGITLNLVEGLSGNLQTQAFAGELDLLVLFSAEAIPGWQHLPLLCEELFFVHAPDARLLPQDEEGITLREVADIPLLLPSRAHGLRRRIDIEFERLELKVRPVAEIDSLSVLMQCVGRGVGGTIKPRSALNIHGSANSAQWTAVPIRDCRLERINYLYARPPEESSDASAIVAQEIRNLVADLIGSFKWQGVSSIP